MTLSTASLTATLLRDRSRQRPETTFPECFACGRSYSRGDGRFCGSKCRAGYDAGGPRHEPSRPTFNLPIGKTGFLIECASCQTQFDSRGLRCCSVECERRHREREQLEAELADNPFRAIKRKCQECGGPIPNWRNGRRVSSATRFCSSRCKDRNGKTARLAAGSPDPVLTPETAKKCPQNGHSQTALGAALDLVAETFSYQKEPAK
jgi:hypothetical protein